MITKKLIALDVSGPALGLDVYSFIGPGSSCRDIRFSPFIDYSKDRPGTFFSQKVIIPVTRVFGHEKIFSNLDPVNTPDVINGWMAIVDHYGVDAEYTQAFFDSIKDHLLAIIAYGYIREDDDPATATRLFNGRELSREEFFSEFFRLVVRYVPSTEVKEPNPFTTFAK